MDEASVALTEAPALSEVWQRQPMAGAAGHTRLCTDAAGHVASALRSCALGDRVTWDAALSLVPSASGPRPMVLVYLHIPSAVLGELCGEVVVLEPRQVTADNIRAQVSAAMERLRRARSASAG